MGIQQTLHIKIDENPNILNELSNYTYQWRLFVVNEIALRKNEYNLLNTPQITIAETGATSLYIDSVTIDSLVSPNGDTLSSTRSVINLEILEPQGSSFYDLLHTAARALGIQNWAKTPLYLQLSFRGYDDEGTPQFIEGNPKWTWRMQINGMENTIDEGGTRYSIQGFLTNDSGITERYGTLPKAFSVVGNTFLEMVSNLEKNWNEYEVKNANRSLSPLVQYKFIFYEDTISDAPVKIDWANLRMIESFDSEHPSRNVTADSTQTGKGTGADQQRADFTNGWRVQNILDVLLSSSDFSEKLRKSYPRLNDAVSDNKDILANLGLAKTYLLEPQVIYTAFDPIANDYERLIVYHIWPYDGLTPILDATPAAGAADAKIAEKKKAQAKAHALFSEKTRNIRRVYNYYYTGKNTDILRFDLRFNNFWTAFISQYSNDQVNSKAPPADSARNTDQQRLSYVDIRQTQIRVAEARRSQEKELADIARQQANNEITPERAAAQQNEIENRFLKSYSSDIAALNNYREQYNLTNQAQLATIKPSSIYAEDLSENDETVFPAIVPIAVDESEGVSTTTQGQGIEEHYFRGRNFYGSLLNQMYSTRLVEWMAIDIDIRGDPHWIGHNNLAKFKALYSNVKATGNISEKSGRVFVNPIEDPSSMITNISNLDVSLRAHLEGTTRGEPNDNPRFELGQQGFIINFFTPDVFRSTDELTNRVNDLGFRIPKRSAFISGLYFVLKVENKFQNGLFTQTLYARRDPHTANATLLELDAARQEIEKERKPTSPTQLSTVQQEAPASTRLNSSCNTLACRNNNPGNLIGGYFGAIGTNSGFSVYPTPEAGTQAMSTQLDRYVDGKTTGTKLETTQDIINTWAPAGHGDNNPTVYANTVASKVGINTTENIATRMKTDPAFKAKFMSAMVDVEAGNGSGYTPEYIEKVIRG